MNFRLQCTKVWRKSALCPVIYHITFNVTLKKNCLKNIYIRNQIIFEILLAFKNFCTNV